MRFEDTDWRTYNECYVHHQAECESVEEHEQREQQARMEFDRQVARTREMDDAIFSGVVTEIHFIHDVMCRTCIECETCGTCGAAIQTCSCGYVGCISDSRDEDSVFHYNSESVVRHYDY